jgi:hypothetical protein
VLLVLAAAVVAVVTGFGWLYLLRDAGVLSLPPRVPRALALQQLAGDDAQPLARMALAWIASGLLIGALLPRASHLGRTARTLAFTISSAVVLFLVSAATDALTNNQALSNHLLPVLGQTASWVALALLVIGFELGGRLGSAASVRA